MRQCFQETRNLCWAVDDVGTKNDVEVCWVVFLISAPHQGTDLCPVPGVRRDIVSDVPFNLLQNIWSVRESDISA